jgi:L-ascorbate metabolism protein UlaG (beta-lactamase superfamily)
MLRMEISKKFLSASFCSLFLGGVCAHAQSFEFNGVQRLTNQEIVLKLSAPTGRAYRIESAGNLPEWTGLVTFPTNNTSSLVHTDSAAPFVDARYYRAVQLAEARVVSGDHLPTTNGEAVIQPRNHATFVMQWDGKMIYNDPVAAASYTGLPKADLILVSHSHSDHFATTTIDTVRGPNAIIIAPQTVYNGLTAAQKAIAIVLGYGESTNVFGLTVEAVYAYNSNHAPLGFGNGYIVTLGGKRIYISGDTGNAPEVRAIADIDVAFLGMNQPFTLTVSDATNVVRAIRPKVVYPYHYRDSSGSTANAATFKNWLGTDLGIEVRLRNWY